MQEHTEKTGNYAGWTREIIREIERHKWLESEKAGHDIGGNRAALDWLARHYEKWKQGKGYA